MITTFLWVLFCLMDVDLSVAMENEDLEKILNDSFSEFQAEQFKLEKLTKENGELRQRVGDLERQNEFCLDQIIELTMQKIIIYKCNLRE